MEILDVNKCSREEWQALLAAAPFEVGALADFTAPITVDLKINGETASFVEIINKMTQHINNLVFQRARVILEDRADALTQKLNKLQLLADKIEQDLLIEIRQLLPESITEEDFR